MRRESFVPFEVTHETIDVTSAYRYLYEPGSGQESWECRRLWGEKRQSRYIESILMGVPLQPLVIEGTYPDITLLDGHRRVRTIENFYDRNHPLVGLERLPALNGCRFHTLDAPFKKRFAAATMLVRRGSMVIGRALS